MLKLGKRATTAKGSVIAYTYDASVSGQASPDPDMKFVAFDVEGCAGQKANAQTGLQPESFYLQIGRDSYHPLAEGVRKPALHATVLAPGKCVRGWVTFQIPTTAKPQYLFVRTVPRIAWSVS